MGGPEAEGKDLHLIKLPLLYQYTGFLKYELPCCCVHKRELLFTLGPRGAPLIFGCIDIAARGPNS